MDKLPREQKEAIILHVIMGFSREEICKIQECGMEALKQRLYRGRKKLADLLGAKDDKNEINLSGFSLKGVEK
jgi:RNA polymerase sigma-70 factor, ECF subfamily